jgi:hypothetical protein
MRRRFVVLVDTSSKAQDDAFLDFAKKSGFGYWHWLNNSWLLTTHNLQTTSKQISDQLLLIFPNIFFLVLEIKEDGSDLWIGFGPLGDEKNMFKWIHENWKRS